MIGWSSPVLPAPEPDSTLRARILYVGGDGPQTIQAIHLAVGDKLDEWAWRFGLKRRKQ